LLVEVEVHRVAVVAVAVNSFLDDESVTFVELLCALIGLGNEQDVGAANRQACVEVVHQRASDAASLESWVDVDAMLIEYVCATTAAANSAPTISSCTAGKATRPIAAIAGASAPLAVRMLMGNASSAKRNTLPLARSSVNSPGASVGAMHHPAPTSTTSAGGGLSIRSSRSASWSSPIPSE
jgi:hypothetical protein